MAGIEALTKYINSRMINGDNINDIKVTLKENPQYEENEFNNSLEEIIRINSKKAKKTEYQRELFMYALLFLGTILLIFNYFAARGASKFPMLIAFIMIIGAIIIFIGPEKLNEIIKKIKDAQKLRKNKM